jgi:hypothetical protein
MPDHELAQAIKEAWETFVNLSKNAKTQRIQVELKRFSVSAPLDDPNYFVMSVTKRF